MHCGGGTWKEDIRHETGLTLSGFTAVHSEVSRLVGLQSCLLHTWTVNFHILWMAALSDSHLIHNITIIVGNNKPGFYLDSNK